MSALLPVLRSEIRRLARSEGRQLTLSTRKLVTRHRRDLAALKRTITRLEKTVALLTSKERERAAEGPAAASNGKETQLRFSPAWLRSHRNRLKLSAAEYAQLVGVSPLSIYAWEKGKARPRARQIGALHVVRKLKRRQALQQLELLHGNGKSEAKPAKVEAAPKKKRGRPAKSKR